MLCLIRRFVLPSKCHYQPFAKCPLDTRACLTILQSPRLMSSDCIKELEYHSLTCYIVKVSSPLLDDSSTTGREFSIYTNVHATSTSLVNKYLLNNSARQNKVRTPCDPENLPSSTYRISRTAISSEGVPTPPVDSLRSLRHDRL